MKIPLSLNPVPLALGHSMRVTRADLIEVKAWQFTTEHPGGEWWLRKFVVLVWDEILRKPVPYSSGKDAFDDFGGVDSGEFLVEAHEGEGEAVVVDSQLVKNGGVKIADTDFVFEDIVAVVIGLTICPVSYTHLTLPTNREV